MLPENPGNMRVCELVTLAMLGRKLANLALNMATWSSSGSRIKPSFFGNMAILFIQVGVTIPSHKATNQHLDVPSVFALNWIDLFLRISSFALRNVR